MNKVLTLFFNILLADALLHETCFSTQKKYQSKECCDNNENTPISFCSIVNNNYKRSFLTSSKSKEIVHMYAQSDEDMIYLYKIDRHTTNVLDVETHHTSFKPCTVTIEDTYTAESHCVSLNNGHVVAFSSVHHLSYNKNTKELRPILESLNIEEALLQWNFAIDHISAPVESTTSYDEFHTFGSIRTAWNFKTLRNKDEDTKLFKGNEFDVVKNVLEKTKEILDSKSCKEILYITFLPFMYDSTTCTEEILEKSKLELVSSVNDLSGETIFKDTSTILSQNTTFSEKDNQVKKLIGFAHNLRNYVEKKDAALNTAGVGSEKITVTDVSNKNLYLDKSTLKLSNDPNGYKVTLKLTRADVKTTYDLEQFRTVYAVDLKTVPENEPRFFPWLLEDNRIAIVAFPQISFPLMTYVLWALRAYSNYDALAVRAYFTAVRAKTDKYIVSGGGQRVSTSMKKIGLGCETISAGITVLGSPLSTAYYTPELGGDPNSFHTHDYLWNLERGLPDRFTLLISVVDGEFHSLGGDMWNLPYYHYSGYYTKGILPSPLEMAYLSPITTLDLSRKDINQVFDSFPDTIAKESTNGNPASFLGFTRSLPYVLEQGYVSEFPFNLYKMSGEKGFPPMHHHFFANCEDTMRFAPLLFDSSPAVPAYFPKHWYNSTVIDIRGLSLNMSEFKCDDVHGVNIIHAGAGLFVAFHASDHLVFRCFFNTPENPYPPDIFSKPEVMVEYSKRHPGAFLGYFPVASRNKLTEIYTDFMYGDVRMVDVHLQSRPDLHPLTSPSVWLRPINPYF